MLQPAGAVLSWYEPDRVTLAGAVGKILGRADNID